MAAFLTYYSDTTAPTTIEPVEITISAGTGGLDPSKRLEEMPAKDEQEHDLGDMLIDRAWLREQRRQGRKRIGWPGKPHNTRKVAFGRKTWLRGQRRRTYAVSSILRALAAKRVNRSR